MKHLLQMWITTLHYITKFPLETYPDVVAMYNKGSHHYLQNETANKWVILFHLNSQFLNTRTDWTVMKTFLEILQFLPCNRVRLDASKIRISLESTSSTPSQRVPGLIVLFPSEITRPDFLYDPLNWKALSATSTDLVVKMTSAETYRQTATPDSISDRTNTQIALRCVK